MRWFQAVVAVVLYVGLGLIEPHGFVLSVCLLAMCLSVAQLGVQALVLGGGLKLPIKEVGVGFGPTVARFRLGFRSVAICMLPGGWLNVGNENRHGGASTEDGLKSLPRVVACVVHLLAPATCFLLAVALIGANSAWEHTLGGFTQIPLGAVLPLGLGQRLIAEAGRVFAAGEFPILFGTLLSKLTALQLLPIPLMPGGNAMIALALPPGDTGSVRPGLQRVGIVVLGVLYLGWLVALAAFAWNGHGGADGR